MDSNPLDPMADMFARFFGVDLRDLLQGLRGSSSNPEQSSLRVILTGDDEELSEDQEVILYMAQELSKTAKVRDRAMDTRNKAIVTAQSYKELFDRTKSLLDRRTEISQRKEKELEYLMHMIHDPSPEMLIAAATGMGLPASQIPTIANGWAAMVAVLVADTRHTEMQKHRIRNLIQRNKSLEDRLDRAAEEFADVSHKARSAFNELTKRMETEEEAVELLQEIRIEMQKGVTIGKNLERFAQALGSHDRENPTHTAWGIGLNPFDMERLGFDEGEEILPGIVVQADKGGTNNFRVLCDGQHTEDENVVEEEVVDAVAADRYITV